jgi:hypothetical protein
MRMGATRALAVRGVARVAMVLAAGASVQVDALETGFSTIRDSALAAVPPLLQAALADTADVAHGQRVLEAMLPVLMNGMLSASDSDLGGLYDTAAALSEVTRFAYESTSHGSPGTPVASANAAAPRAAAVVPLPALTKLYEVLKKAFERCVARRQAAVTQFQANPDHDEEDMGRLAESLEGESDFITNLIDTLGYTIKQHKAAVLPQLQADLGPYLMTWMNRREELHVPLRAAAVCLCDDLLEFVPREAGPTIQSILLDQLKDCIACDNVVLRHPAVYGVGIVAQHGDNRFDAVAAAYAAQLHALVTSKDARSDDNEQMTDNAVSSLIKIAKYRSHAPGVKAEAIMRGVLAYLPAKADSVEACVMHGWLVAAVEAWDPLWLGADQSRLAQVVAVLAKGLLVHKKNVGDDDGDAAGGDDDGDDDDEDDEGDELFDEATLTRLRGLLGSWKTSPHARELSKAVSGLSSQQRAVLVEFGMT